MAIVKIFRHTNREVPLYKQWPFDAAEANRRRLETAQVLGIPERPKLVLANGVSMELVLIPAGQFLMGSPADERDRDNDEGPQHQVTISRPFYMGIYEVTQEQWKAVMGTTIVQQRNKAGQRLSLCGQGSAYPMYYVSWEEAVQFCERLSQKTGRTVHLPTEAQWEYACRASSQTRFSYGDDPDYSQLENYAWCPGKSSNTMAHPVGQKRPNAFGLYDMHGNVREWCSDRYADSYADAANQDPQGPDSGTDRVVRGGGWISLPQRCRSASRVWYTPDFRNFYTGFRVAVDWK